uniref:2-oxoglutarate and iron-dependent oxygenase JMJD4 n=1 Tax=Lonchura striata TaxID=40157 RepID=UPI001293FBE5|nr:2-oxoglutarate and iron-dependent oxygenase JMJD4 [Lonchura striata domestica]
MDRATFACSTAFFRDFGNSSPGALPGGHVDFIDKADSFTYSDFFRDYLIPNHPCIFSAKFTEDWGSRKNWVTWDGKPNFEHLLQKFGEAVVPVANCDVKEYNSNPKEQLPFKEYVEYWREYIRNGYRSSRGCLYLKDWHLSRAFPEQDVYTTPVYFSSDWLNEYWDAVAVDDFRFVYMGPKGSWTPFHADVFRSYSWSANICGRKRWLLYPAGQEEFLKDRHGNLPFDVTAPDLRDKRIYPRYSQSQPPLEILQEAGEIVFIPSGWHHQVYNLEFYNFLKVIAENRISILEKGLDEESSSQNNSKAAISTLGMLHAVFDLKRTVKVLSSLSANEDFRKLDLTSLSPSPEALLQHLESAIDTALL